MSAPGVIINRATRPNIRHLIYLGPSGITPRPEVAHFEILLNLRFAAIQMAWEPL